MSRNSCDDNPCDDVALRALPALRAAGSVSHSRDNLLAHLIGTWSILSAWQASPAVRAAGLAHSVYSTSFFRYALFDIRRRAVLRRLIGEEAEALVFLFCVLDRAALRAQVAGLRALPSRLTAARHDGKGSMRLSGRTIRAVLMVECANVAEQATGTNGGPAPWMAKVAAWLRLSGLTPPGLASAPPTLAEAAEREAIAEYSAALRLPGRRAFDRLGRAIALNPLAAEPRILRALCALERGDAAGGLVDATRGRNLLTAWSTPWDKRFDLSTWHEIASAIVAAAALEDRRRWRLPMYTAVRKALLR